GMLVASAIFWPVVAAFYIRMSSHSEACKAEGWRGHGRLLNTLFGKPGIFRKQVPEWLAYFKYSFHPWQQNNSHHLARIDELAAQAEAAYNTTH
ncbi:MAG: metal-dependent hydrolase, partial [Salinisphaera sp.]|nr:metal-dependent hydrolase [Salinisphaera sp.]